MKSLFLMAALCSLFTLTGCEYMKMPGKDTVIGSVKGASAVAEAKEMHQQIMDYIGGDAEAVAAMSGPAEFFKQGSDLLGGDFDVPVMDIFEAYPDYVSDIPDQWAAGVKALNDYAEKSGKAIPQSIEGWRINAEAGWEQAKKASELQDKAEKVVELFKMVKPFALMVL